MSRKTGATSTTTLGDRLTSGILSALFAGLTLIGYAFFVRYHYRTPGSVLFHHQLFEILTSKVSLYILAAASLLGFVLGPTRMGEVFGFFWGTNDWKESNDSGWLGNAAAILVMIVIAIVVWRMWF